MAVTYVPALPGWSQVQHTHGPHRSVLFFEHPVILWKVDDECRAVPVVSEPPDNSTYLLRSPEGQYLTEGKKKPSSLRDYVDRVVDGRVVGKLHVYSPDLVAELEWRIAP